MSIVRIVRHRVDALDVGNAVEVGLGPVGLDDVVVNLVGIVRDADDLGARVIGERRGVLLRLVHGATHQRDFVGRLVAHGRCSYGAV